MNIPLNEMNTTEKFEYTTKWDDFNRYIRMNILLNETNTTDTFD